MGGLRRSWQFRGFVKGDRTRRQWLLRVAVATTILLLLLVSPELMGLDITWALLLEPELLFVLVPLLIAAVIARWDTLRWMLRMNYATLSTRLRRGRRRTSTTPASP